MSFAFVSSISPCKFPGTSVGFAAAGRVSVATVTVTVASVAVVVESFTVPRTRIGP